MRIITALLSTPDHFEIHSSAWLRSSIGMILALGSLFLSEPAAAAKSPQSRPNVVFVMTDNHGAWTLGCYGNPDIRTPHIDRMAEEGTLFTQAYSSNPVCSPTRATYLTGLMPSQHGVHCFLTGGGLQTGPDARCTLDELTSLPEILKKNGYSCGLVGKWHLGGNLHPQEGFEDYWITMPHGGTSTFYDADIIENGQIRKEPEYLTDFWTRHAVKFIDQNAKTEKPFFLFLSYNGPYALSRLLLREGKNRHADYYADKPLESFPRLPAHPWQKYNLDYHNNPISIRRVATEVSGVDDGVGTVLQSLKDHGIDENTVVIFVADQGWAGGQGGYFGMGDHTRPVTADDEMMRIPMIWRHPGSITSSAVSNVMVTNYDFLPTLLSYLNLSDQSPVEHKLPGKDFSAELKVANSQTAGEEAVYYEFESLRSVRTKKWKYVHRHPNGPHELYDMVNDPDEFTNLVSDPKTAEIKRFLEQQLDSYFQKYSIPKYNMWQGGTSQARVYVGIDEETAQVEAIQPPPLTEGFEPQKLQVPSGFTVELAAGPPLVQHPTFATFDDQGRLFVCENAGVNMTAEELEDKLPNSIRLLEDLDQDGKFDRSTVFADKMTFPMGGAWHDGALYVASPPYIWRLEDTDNDGVADRRDQLVSQFGYNGNAASIHGCVSGPDGRLYWCDGYHGHQFKDETGKVVSERKGSYIFSCRPDGSDVRIHCGGGMDNPVEVDFTTEGEMLGTVNIMYTRPRVDCLVHWLHGGAYPHREQVLQELKSTGDFLGPVHRFGHVAISGLTRYRSGTMDYRWRDQFFAAQFNVGKVVRIALEREGSTFRAEQREFLTSTDMEFHPTDVAEDADGSLLVVDTGGWFYRGCPTSQFPKPDILGGIYRIKRTGMTTQVDPRGLLIAWDRLSLAEVIKLFADTRYSVRERAIAECVKLGESSLDSLARVLQSGDIWPRQCAIQALTALVPDHPQAYPAIRAALQDRDASIRHSACRALAIYPDEAALEQLTERLKDDQPHVRRVAARALGAMKNIKAVDYLFQALTPEMDRAFEHAVIYALIEINDQTATRTGLEADSPQIRKVALIALDQMDAGDLTSDEVVREIASNNEDLQRAAIQIYVRHASWTSQSLSVIEHLLDQQGEATESSSVLRELLVRSINQPDVAVLVGNRLSAPLISAKLQSLLLEVIASGQNVRIHETWISPLERLLASSDATVLTATISAVARLNEKQFQQRLTEIGEDVSLPILVRVSALEAATNSQSQLSDHSFDLLLDVVQESPKDAYLAAQRIGSAALTSEQLLRVAKLIQRASPTALPELIRAFARLKDVDVATAFLQAMNSASSLDTISAVQFSEVIKSYPSETLPNANALLAKLKQREAMHVEKVEAFLPYLNEGSAERGKDVFFGKKSNCATCHQVGGQGKKIGPDLTTIGASRTSRDLLESIVFPSATLVRDYEPFSILIEDGKVLNGIVVRETVDTIYIQQKEGEPVAVQRDEIELLSPSTVSIMPNGLDRVLSQTELADLIAYLQSLKSGEPAHATR